MTGKTSYCVTVMISCAANIEDASILFFCCALSLFLLLSESFSLLCLALETNLFFLGGEPDSLALSSSLGVFSLHHCSTKSAVVYSWPLLTADLMNRCKCAAYLSRRCFSAIAKDMQV